MTGATAGGSRCPGRSVVCDPRCAWASAPRDMLGSLSGWTSLADGRGGGMRELARISHASLACVWRWLIMRALALRSVRTGCLPSRGTDCRRRLLRINHSLRLGDRSREKSWLGRWRDPSPPPGAEDQDDMPCCWRIEMSWPIR